MPPVYGFVPLCEFGSAQFNPLLWYNLLMQYAAQPLIFCGPTMPGGLYLLRMAVPTTLAISMGRFQGGRPLIFPASEYLYIGSALGQRGASTLAQRLLRHTARSNGQPAHAIRGAVAAAFGLQLDKTSPKRCFWHVDYLLDCPAVALVQIFALYTSHSSEHLLAQHLAADTQTFLVAHGLGACDDPGSTHLLGVTANEEWWATLPNVLSSYLNGHPE
jgi:Uri superfamily endonuclease